MARMGWREANRARWVGIRPAHEGEQVVARSSHENSTVVLYTVPAGRTLYLCGANLGVRATAAGYVLISIYTDLGAVYWEFLYYGFPAAGGAGSYVFPFSPPLELPSGYTVKDVSSAPGLWTVGAIWGWVE